MSPRCHPQFPPFQNTTSAGHEAPHLSTSTAALSTTTIYRTLSAPVSHQTFTSTASTFTNTFSNMTKLTLPTTTLTVWRFLTSTASTSGSPSTSSETSTSSIDLSTVTSSSLSPQTFYTLGLVNKVIATSSSLSSPFSAPSVTATPVTDSIISSLSSSTTIPTPTKIPVSPILLFTAGPQSSTSTVSSTTSSQFTSSSTVTTSLFDPSFHAPTSALSTVTLSSPFTSFPIIPTITSIPNPAFLIPTITSSPEAAISSAATPAPPSESAASGPANKTPAIVAAATIPVVAFIFLISLFMLWFKRQSRRKAIKAKIDSKLEEANEEGKDFAYGDDQEPEDPRRAGPRSARERRATLEDGRGEREGKRDSTLGIVNGERGEMAGRLSMGRVRASEDESLSEARRHYYQRFSKRLSGAVVRF